MSASSFRFAQFEFPWVLGLPTGRYVLRDETGADPRRIVALVTLGAPQRRLLRRRPRRGAAPTPGPTPVPTSRVTLIDPTPDANAGDWLSSLDVAVHAGDELALLNRMLEAHRIATADPYIHECSLEQAIAVRAGHGSGEAVADGRWSAVRELAPAQALRLTRRSAALRSQERLAALLGARDEMLVCEELALRARLDTDAGRTRLAALEVRTALDAALVELTPRSDIAGMAERLHELHALREQVLAAANAALSGPPTSELDEIVTQALSRVEGALRLRTARGQW